MAALLLGACDTDATPPKIDPTGSVGNPVQLTFLAYGPEEEVAGMESMVERFNDENPTVLITLEAVADSEDVMDRLAGEDPPDIYLLSQRDIAQVAADGFNQPLDELLDARGVDFSDHYKRDAIQAYSFDNHLQCMPYGVSPMVVYYNTDLIDFDEIEEAGLEAPTFPDQPHRAIDWSIEQFAVAAEWASSRPGAKGTYIEPSLEGLAPFIYSGGGQVFDDGTEPTRLAMSDGSTREALVRVLEIVRTEDLTPTRAELEDRTALEMFIDGELGMIAGYRNLVPELRAADGLNFDVMPMPSLGSRTTVGDVTGLCMAPDPVSAAAAADLIAYAVSAESVAEVAKAGYLVPANNQVAESDDFLQPDLEPAKARVFNASVRDIVLPPLLESWDALEEAVQEQVETLFYAPTLDLDAITEQMDEQSGPVVEQLVIDEEDRAQDEDSEE